MKIEFTREDLSLFYAQVKAENPLLQRMETQLKLIGWTDEEIRTAQLLTACRSNASLLAHAKSLENRVAVIHPGLNGN